MFQSPVSFLPPKLRLDRRSRDHQHIQDENKQQVRIKPKGSMSHRPKVGMTNISKVTNQSNKMKKSVH